MTRQMDGGRLAVVSPHLDDGVLSCGQLLAGNPGAVVITVFAGRPPPSYGLTEWDRSAGFSPGEDTVGLRRREDEAALAVLRAVPVWLDFSDSQYPVVHDTDVLADALEEHLLSLRARRVMVPLGLFHDDHRQASDAGLRVARRRPELSWWAYEDALYRTIPGLVQERLGALNEAQLRPTLDDVGADGFLTDKERAVERYPSQLRALATPGRLGHADAFAPERYWRLHP